MLAHMPSPATPAIPAAAAPPAPVPPLDSILALSDGTLWTGWAGPRRVSVAGAVQVDEDRILLDGDVAMRVPSGQLQALLERLDAAALAGRALRGCATAAGATTPIHAEVARAMARGEIGRP